jgi:quinol monooxygenase YgiN
LRHKKIGVEGRSEGRALESLPLDSDRLGRGKRMKVTVLAMAKAKEGMEETVRQELLSLVNPTRSEPGCINYDLHQADDDKSLFIFYENWKSKEDLEKHLGMPYLKAFLEKSGGLLAKPLEVILLEMISEKKG